MGIKEENNFNIKSVTELSNKRLSISKLDKYIDILFKWDKHSLFSKNKNPKESQIISDFKKKINILLSNKIDSFIKKQDYKSTINLLIKAVQIDIKNVILAACIIDKFKEKKLYTECIELYKTMFLYEPKPEYFEKIGDINMLLEDYETAADSYMNAVEISDKPLNLYLKLADLFEKANDKESKDICLKQIELIKGQDER